MAMTSNLPLACQQAQPENQLQPFNKEGTGGTTGSAVGTSIGANLTDEELLRLLHARNLQLPANNTATLKLPNAVIEVPKATGEDWEVHPLYTRLTSQEAKDAFEQHWKRTAKAADSDGKKRPMPSVRRDFERRLLCPDDDPHFFRHKCVEVKYSQPEGFLSLNRSFFPTGKGEGNEKDDLKRDAAVRSLPSNAGQSEIASMIQLQDELLLIFAKEVPAKITLKYHEKAAAVKIMHMGKVVTQFDLIRKEFHENPSRALLAKLYDLDYGLREDDHSMNEIKYEICQELKVYCTATDVGLDFVNKGKGTVPKAHFLNRIICDKFRQISRTKIYGRPKHGISLTISNKKEGKGTSRRSKCFSFDDNVRGWEGPQHVAFLEEKNSRNESFSGAKEEVQPRAPQIATSSIDLHPASDEPREDGIKEDSYQSIDQSFVANEPPEDGIKEDYYQSIDRVFVASNLEWPAFAMNYSKANGKPLAIDFDRDGPSWRRRFTQCEKDHETYGQFRERKISRNKRSMSQWEAANPPPPATSTVVNLQKTNTNGAMAAAKQPAAKQQQQEVEAAAKQQAAEAAAKQQEAEAAVKQKEAEAAAKQKGAEVVQELQAKLRAAQHNLKHAKAEAYITQTKAEQERNVVSHPLSKAINKKGGQSNNKQPKKSAAKVDKPTKKAKLLPRTSAPEDEYEAMEVSKHKFNQKGELSLFVLYQPRQENRDKYEEYRSWSAVGPALVDFVDPETNNKVIEYGTDCLSGADRDKVLRSIKKAIDEDEGEEKGQHGRKPLREEYPEFCALMSNKSKLDNNKSKPDDDKSKPDESTCPCGHDHSQPMDVDKFEPITFPCYFMEDNALGFLFGKVCKSCIKPVETTGMNKPSASKPVYVCRALMKSEGGSSCATTGGVWCNKCGLNASCSSGGRKRKRHNGQC